MAVKMMLEQVRDRLRLYADYLSTGGYEGKALSPADVEACADAIDAHLAQPAQAVNVTQPMFLAAEKAGLSFVTQQKCLSAWNSAIGNAQAVDVATNPSAAIGPLAYSYRDCLKEANRPTRAIGNAQEEST